MIISNSECIGFAKRGRNFDRAMTIGVRLDYRYKPFATGRLFQISVIVS